MDQDSVDEDMGRADGPRSIATALRLVEGATSSLGKDLDRFALRQRENDNVALMIVFGVFAIYAVITLAILQITIDDGPQSIAVFAKEPISKRLIGAIAFVSVGFPMILSLIARLRSLSVALRLNRRHLRIRIKFAEEVIVRVTTWEKRFKGDYYQKSILRLRVTLLSQLIEEMEALAQYRMSLFPFRPSIGKLF